MASHINKRRLLALGISIAYKYFINIAEWESDSDSENDEEFIQELINIEGDVTIRGKRQKVTRIDNFVEYTIPRLTGKQFKEHFRIKPAVFENLENKLGNCLLNLNETGRPTISVRKQLLATLWLLATPDSYR